MLSIGEMAKRSGAAVQTLRYYEKEGLDIDEKMRSLKGIHQTLFELTQCCKDVGPTSECAILDALERCESC
jgi:hypothetical protein